jgi:predicted nucleic-acid-binding Zn-ribbon protein
MPRERKRPRANRKGGRFHECPHCGTNLMGELIPLEAISKGFYPVLCRECGGRNHYGRQIARVDPDLDRVVEYMCPDCGGTWPRR